MTKLIVVNELNDIPVETSYNKMADYHHTTCDVYMLSAGGAHQIIMGLLATNMYGLLATNMYGLPAML